MVVCCIIKMIHIYNNANFVTVLDVECVHPKKKRKQKDVPLARMHYLPIIPRLKRLFASYNSARHMRWHFENPREPGVLCHPSDGEALKHFDRTWLDFASEPRNIRLGLCADGFSPFSSQ